MLAYLIVMMEINLFGFVLKYSIENFGFRELIGIMADSVN